MAFVVLGVRAKDVPGVAEEGAVRAWIQAIRADLEQASYGTVVPELEWRGWLESPLLREELGCLELAALAAHARTLTAEPVAGGVIAVVNCTIGRTGTTGRDVIAQWITGGGQGGLRRCRYCGALHLAPNASLSHCWGSPEGGHAFDSRETYELPRAADGDAHYRNCSSCHAIWAFDGNSRGHCPKNPSGHTGGDRYSIARTDSGAGGWAECTACQRVIAVELADRGCIDSQPCAPVAHTLATDHPLTIAQESFPSLSWGTRALAEALGVHGDLDATGRGTRAAPHPRFTERGPAPSAAAAWLAGWLHPDRVITRMWKPGDRYEVELGFADAAAPARVLLQIAAPAAVYGIELRPNHGNDAHLHVDESLQLRRFLGRGALGVPGWRACQACGAAVDSSSRSCAAGGLHEYDPTEFAVPFDRGYVRATAGWRRCVGCNGLWHEASGDGSTCAAGGPHRSDATTAYALRPSETTTGFRACSKCRALVDPQLAGTMCGAGGTHEVRRSPYFSLDVMRRGATAQHGWSTCRKCGIVGFTASQSCAKSGGAHVLEASDHVPERWGVVPGITSAWRCTQCACMFGRAGVCTRGGRHRSAGMFPDFALRDAAAVDRALTPTATEPQFPEGVPALLALRRSWQICRDCGVVFSLATAAACPSTKKKHVAGSPTLRMSSDTLEGRRVLVGLGDALAADRDGFVVRVVRRDEHGVMLVVEPAGAAAKTARRAKTNFIRRRR